MRRYLFSLFFILLLTAIGCVPSTSTGGKRTSSSSNSSTANSGSDSSDTGDSDSSSNIAFKFSNNYITAGSSSFNNIVTIPSDYSDVLKLEGEEVHNFFSVENNRNLKLCLASYYTINATNTALVLAGVIRSETQNGQNVYYLQLQSIDAAANQQNCSSAGINIAIDNDHSSAVKRYRFEDLCTNCTQFSSLAFKLYTEGGVEVTSITVNQLSFTFSASGSGDTNPNQCTFTSQCAASGTDYCCVSGQCVKDKAPKDPNNTAANQAAIDLITAGTRTYNDYPDLFYLCPFNNGNVTGGSTSGGSTTGGSSTGIKYDIINNPEDRLSNLAELYECTKEIDDETKDEERICTIVHTDVGEAIQAAGAGGTNLGHSLATRSDDNSLGSHLANAVYSQAVTEVWVGDSKYYDSGDVSLADLFTVSLATNDQLISGASTVQLLASANYDYKTVKDVVKIKYRVDGSCEVVPNNTTLAKCIKYYVHGQNTGKANDHPVARGQVFEVPNYGDATYPVIAYVNGLRRIEGQDYNKTAGPPFTLTFINDALVQTGEEVIIEYYVTIASHPTLLDSQKAAMEAIGSICNCTNNYSNPRCYLQKVTRADSSTDYVCKYKGIQDDTQSLLEQTVYVSGNAVPLKYYDANGVLKEERDASEAAQEVPTSNGVIANGSDLSYAMGTDIEVPNNTAAYVGFHEVYGTISGDANSPARPYRVDVKEGKVYHIYVNTGYFSSCANCGSDYYTNLQKLFPDNFTTPGSGFYPDLDKTSRYQSSNHTIQYRADDILFGRACFVPMTMIPWTHTANADLQTQRLRRQTAQHAMFANGYNRDWYGFDYGSVIGSFDGVKWFAIGNQRRIKADTNKLFIAVNTYFGDLTNNVPYTVRVSEAEGAALSIDLPETDAETVGAECQRYHQCDTDRDCATQLGWDYVCGSVSGLESYWPEFDINGNEIANRSSAFNLRTLFNAQGSTKRCIYRGRGALCQRETGATGSYTPYYASSAKSTDDDVRFKACAPNSYCADITGSTFNTKINRYNQAQLILASNPGDVPNLSHSFGLSANIIGRPFEYNGTQDFVDDIDPNMDTIFNRNNVVTNLGMCIPGKNPTATNFRDANTTVPPAGTDYQGDKVLGAGIVTNTTGTSNSLYSLCPVFNEDGNYFFAESPATNLDADEVRREAVEQVLSTSLLDFIDNGDIVDAFLAASLVTTKKLQQNSCLRNAGASCFTDMDCGPSDAFKTAILSLDNTLPNSYEYKFWSESLICGQEAEKYSANYDPKKNVCCRELGKTLTIGTDENGGAVIKTDQIAGYDINLNDTTRNSRANTSYGKTNSEPNEYPALTVAQKDTSTAISADMGKQFNTLHRTLERTCCTKHWVREFDTTTNGGGHAWGPEKLQSIDKTNFSCMNYTGTPGDCTDVNDASCNIRSIPTPEIKKYTEWLSLMELIGIPQVLIGALTNMDGESITCADNTANPIDGTVTNNTPEVVSGANGFFRANEEDNFEFTKQVFSKDTFACCIPSSSAEVSSTVTDADCCSGKVADVNGQRRCCLPDYTNLSVYYNRYVSSAGADKGDNYFDEFTGRPKNPTDVENWALSQGVCCSGKVARGVAISELGVPGASDEDYMVRRFIMSNNAEDNINGEATNYDRGLRWNNDVYCVP